MARKGAPPRALAAAASRVPLTKPPPRRITQEAWQKDARVAAEIPELKQLIRWRGHQLSKLKLYAAALPLDAGPDAEPVPVTDEATGIPPAVGAVAVEELARFRSRIGGQAEILRRLETNLSKVGEGWVVYLSPRDAIEPDEFGRGGRQGEEGEWIVCSVSEIAYKNDHYLVKRSPGVKDEDARVLVDGEDDLFRVWEPDDEWFDLPDCALKGCLDEAETLKLLAAQVQAEARSGTPALIFCVPNELSFGPASPTAPLDADGEPTDAFQAELEEHLDGAGDPLSRKTLIPLLLRGPGEHMTPDRLRTIDLARKPDPTVDTRMDKTLMRLARGMDAPVEVVMGLESTTFANACVDEATEILTLDGWRHHADVEPGTLVLTLDHKTGISEWQPVLAMHRFDVVDEPVLRIERQAHSSVTTGPHRWPVVLADSGKRVWRTTTGGFHTRLNTNCRVPTAAPCRDVPTEAKWSDDLVELVAWFYTEGHIDRRGGRGQVGGLSVITQSAAANPGKVARIRNVLERLIGTASERLTKDGDWAWREYTDPNSANVRFYLSRTLTAAIEVLAPDKVPTAEFIRSLTAAQLELFLAVSVLADGWTVNTGTVMFSQNDPARVDAYELAAILSGRTPSRYSKVQRGTGTLRGRFFDQHFCSITARTTIQPMTTTSRRPGQIPGRLGGGSSAWGTLTGIVWCPTTANGTWMARRNGSVYFTGNSQVSQDTWEQFLQPRAVFLVDAVTVGAYRSVLIDAGVDEETAARIFVWYDASDLVAQPDVDANADAGHDRNVISDAAWRRAKGFGDDDAPDALEVLVRTALRRGQLASPMVLSMLDDLAAEGGVTLPTLDELSAPAQGSPGEATVRQLATLLVMAERRVPHSTNGLSLALSAAPALEPAAEGRSPGHRLAALDSELRTRLLVLADVAMGRALEKAGNRLRGRAGPTRDTVRNTASRYVAQTLGPVLVAAAGLTDADLLADAFDGLEEDFLALGAMAQAEMLTVMDGLLGGLPVALRAQVARAQVDDLAGAWTWLRVALLELAARRLYDPDPAAPADGEFDPTLSVAPALIRTAMSLAGGADGLVASGKEDGLLFRSGGREPAGGIGTGERMRGLLVDAGGRVEGFIWEYGAAFRKRPFEPHRELDGKTFAQWDDDLLLGSGIFGYTRWVPGDHANCRCTGVPVLLGPDGREVE